MIVHILPPSATFKAVSYNTDKIERDKGELMKVANFGSLQGLGHLRPEDYRQYLQTVSAQNKRVSFAQFHAVISAKGKEYEKDALTEIATQWLATMGYEKQPYLIVYHKDTDNNHVHIVTTRIGRDGKKISSSFENMRAIHNLNKIMGIDEKHSASQDIKTALSYSFSTKAQFLMLLENKGYTLEERGNELAVIKFGIKQDTVDLEKVQEIIKQWQPNMGRKAQLKAIVHKYAGLYDTPGFTAMVKEKFGIDLVFHAKVDQAPYGYTVIDHSTKTLFKGGELMPVKALLAANAARAPVNNEEWIKHIKVSESGKSLKYYYSTLLQAALYNYPHLVQGLQHQGLSIIQRDHLYILADQETRVYLDCKELLNDKGYEYLVQQLNQQVHSASIPGMQLASDMDDEAIYGRNRRRKKMAPSKSR
jgi:hypothetical protein